jgi:hypothetical protein
MELLVALMLLGLLSAMALGGVRLGARTWETVTEKAGDNSHRQVVRSFLARELAQAVPVFAGESQNSRLAYEGDSKSLVFVAPLAPHFGLGGLQRLELAIVDSESSDSRQLILLRRPFHRADTLNTPPGEEEDEVHLLLDGIEQAEFAYLESVGDGFWTTEWRGREALPAFVRLQVTFAASGSLAWPDLVVANRITTKPGCMPGAPGTWCRKR